MACVCSISLAHSQTPADPAFPIKSRGRPAPLAAAAIGSAGTMTLAQLNAVFDAARPNQVEILVGPGVSPKRVLRGMKEASHPPLIIPVPLHTPASYRRTFRILADHPEETDRYDDLILQYSKRYGLDARLVKSIIAAESEYNPQAVSPRGARGLMQVMPPTAEALGVPGSDLSDPEANVRAGTAYLRDLFQAAWRKFKLQGALFVDAPMWVIQRVIAAYNAGPRAMSGFHCLPQTRNYVRKVLLYYQSGITDIRRPPVRRVRLPAVSMFPTAGFLF